jgi:hypothetical protein
MLSFSLSFLKLWTPSACRTVDQDFEYYLSISFSLINLFSAAASRFVKESLHRRGRSDIGCRAEK